MYSWFVVLHVLGLVVFLASHGVAMWVAFRPRTERERAVVRAMLGMSALASRLAYVGLLALGIGGIGAAAAANLLTTSWVVASYVVLAVVLLAMFGIAAPYYYGLRDALDGTDKVARLDDEALAARLRSRRPDILAVIGGGGLAILVLLMTLRPGLW
jgi:small-conductance mechanosensitive channel